MEGYQRAYRDPNSPLTPLTPLLANVFDFNIDNSNQSFVSLNQAARLPKSPIIAGLEAIGSLFQYERGHRLGSAPASSVVRRQHSGKENSSVTYKHSTGRPIPSVRQKRGNAERLAVKAEDVDVIPRINIEPPPRRKRNTSNEFNQHVKTEEDDFNISDFSENADFVRQQQKQLEKYQAHNKRRFNASKVRLASPVPPKPLSPRLGAFLTSWGMNCLKSIFERQEIDMQTFCCLTADDLALLGIEDAEKRELVLKAVDFLKNQLQKE